MWIVASVLRLYARLQGPYKVRKIYKLGPITRTKDVLHDTLLLILVYYTHGL